MGAGIIKRKNSRPERESGRRGGDVFHAVYKGAFFSYYYAKRNPETQVRINYRTHTCLGRHQPGILSPPERENRHDGIQNTYANRG
ncbi:hypothetical protein ACFL02_06095 [Planctomycetota bacterium]